MRIPVLCEGIWPIESQITKRWLMLGSAVFVHLVGYLALNAYLGTRGISYDVSIPWDDQVPFVKYFAPFYSMVYFVPIAAFFIVWSRYDLIVGEYKAFIGAALISFLVFWIYPVEFRLRATPRPPYDFFENIVRFFYWMDDPPYNCMPSLHVALAMISARAVWLYRRSWGIGFFILASLISLSTVFIRQHYILDVVGGLGVSLLMILLFLRMEPSKYSQPFEEQKR